MTDIGTAARALRAGRLVAFPTETVYGLGADASNPAAVARIFEVKGRPADHPVIVHLPGAEHLERWALDVPDEARALAAACWPGPLTLVLRRGRHVPDVVTGGRDTVGLRVPAHPVAQALLAAFGGGIAAPSANRFGRVSPTTATHVRHDLGDDVEVILDGGPATVGVESTIVELVGPRPVVLRHGGVPAERLEEILGRQVERRAQGPARAPGMLEAHYAPRARVEVVDDVATAVARAAATPQAGVLAPGDAPVPASLPHLDAGADAETYARVLYARLREADEIGLVLLVAVAPPDEGIGTAVRDRLRRAAASS